MVHLYSHEQKYVEYFQTTQVQRLLFQSTLLVEKVMLGPFLPEALLIGIVVGLTASVVTGLFAQGFIFRARSPTYIDGFVAAALTVSRIPRPSE